MDNRIFNVNGKGEDMLRATLELAFAQKYCGWTTVNATSIAEGWCVSEQHGLILLWHCRENDPGITDIIIPKVHKFLVPLTASEVTPTVWKWLDQKETWKNTKFMDWDIKSDHDGSSEKGWRVWVGDWGKVGDELYTICAVRPSYLWLGK